MWEASVVDAVSSRLLSFFFSSRRRHTRWNCDWSSDVCSSDLARRLRQAHRHVGGEIAMLGIAGTLDDDRGGGRHLEQNAAGEIGEGGEQQLLERSEERRVGKECRSRWSPYQ